MVMKLIIRLSIAAVVLLVRMGTVEIEGGQNPDKVTQIRIRAKKVRFNNFMSVDSTHVIQPPKINQGKVDVFDHYTEESGSPTQSGNKDGELPPASSDWMAEGETPHVFGSPERPLVPLEFSCDSESLTFIADYEPSDPTLGPINCTLADDLAMRCPLPNQICRTPRIPQQHGTDHGICCTAITHPISSCQNELLDIPTEIDFFLEPAREVPSGEPVICFNLDSKFGEINCPHGHKCVGLRKDLLPMKEDDEPGICCKPSTYK